MANTTVSDALVFPHDEGLPNISDDDETWDSAGFVGLMGGAVDGGSYARSDTELTFTGHDGTNDQVNVTSGVAFLDFDGETVNVQSTRGGGRPPSYDTALPTLPSISVILPTEVGNLNVTDSTLNDVWLAYATNGTVSGISAGEVYLRHGSTESAPVHPNVKLGQANPDDASADVLSNRGGQVTVESITADTVTADELTGGLTGSLSVETVFGEHIESQSPSGVAAAEFTTGIGTDYHTHLLAISDLVPASDAVSLNLQVSTDGGDNWKSGASDYEYAHQTIDTGGTSGTQNSSGASEIRLATSVGSAAGEGAAGTVQFSNPGNSNLVQLFSFDMAYIASGSARRKVDGIGTYETAEAIDGVRLLFESGNIESGEVDLLGVMT